MRGPVTILVLLQIVAKNVTMQRHVLVELSITCPGAGRLVAPEESSRFVVIQNAVESFQPIPYACYELRSKVRPFRTWWFAVSIKSERSEASETTMNITEHRKIDIMDIFKVIMICKRWSVTEAQVGELCGV